MVSCYIIGAIGKFTRVSQADFDPVFYFYIYQIKHDKKYKYLLKNIHKKHKKIIRSKITNMKYSNFYIIKKNGSRIFRSAHIMQ